MIEEILALPAVLKIALALLVVAFLFGLMKRMIKLVIIVIAIIVFIAVIYPMFDY